MIYPSIEELTKGKINRYTLVIATARGARMVTDEYIQQRENAETAITKKDNTDKMVDLIDRELCDEKAVKIAIRRINEGYYSIINAPSADGTIQDDTQAE